jgi:hypothetical protein
MFRRLPALLALLAASACAAPQKPQVSLAPWAKPVNVSVEKKTVAAGVSVAF